MFREEQKATDKYRGNKRQNNNKITLLVNRKPKVLTPISDKQWRNISSV